MRYLLDTNVISELRKPPGRVHAGVAGWANSLPEDSVFISSISVFEIEKGIQLKQRTDPIQAARLRSWFDDQVRVQFASRILPFCEETALVAARMHIPDPKAAADSFIAATAQVHNLIVATRNVSDFANMGVELINPWEL